MAATGLAHYGVHPGSWRRIACLTGAIASFGLAFALARVHALAPWGAPALVALWAFLVWRRPGVWLFAVPALLPLANLSPWTGALMFDEFDLLVLGVAAGGYARMATGCTAVTPASKVPAFSRLAKAALVVLVLSTLVSLALGLLRAESAGFGLYQDYSGGLNPLRVAKSLVFGLLLLPLLQRELGRSQRGAMRRFTAGICCGLALTSLSVLWERAAFPGVLEFRRFYRATAMFWEMHLGGAALDFHLVLSIPFAAAMLLAARTRARACMAAALLALAAFACVATYSRGLYLGIAIAVLVALALRAQRSAAALRLSPGLRIGILVWLLLVAIALKVSFAAQGYAGALTIAVLAGAAMSLGRRGALELAKPSWLLLACGAAGGLLAALATAASAANAWMHVLAVGALLVLGTMPGDASGTARITRMVLFGWFSVAAITAIGGVAGATMREALAAVGLIWLALAGKAAVRWPLWPDAGPAQLRIGAAIVVLVEALALFAGESYLTRRFDLLDRDFSGRLAHWRGGLDLLRSPSDWLFGRGLGRFPAESSLPPRHTEMPGSYAVIAENGDRFARVVGPVGIDGLSGVFAMSQRIIPVAGTSYRVSIDVRTARPTELYLRVCERHLIYEAGCAGGKLMLKAGGWRRVDVRLDGSRLAGGPWYAPRLGFFSIGVGTGDSADVDNVSVRDAGGAARMVNGDFAGGGARWFPTGRYYYQPWHVDNTYLEILVAQGLVGLLALAVLVAAAFHSLLGGIARAQPWLPACAAALSGGLVVGLLGSMQNAPRVMLLFWLLLWVALFARHRQDIEAAPGTAEPGSPACRPGFKTSGSASA